MSEWHGWRRSDSGMALHIGPLPGRKSICLYEEGNGYIDVFAFFTSEAKARKALELLDSFVEGLEGGR